MITPDRHVTLSAHERARVLASAQQQVPRLLLAEVTVLIRQTRPAAARLRVRVTPDYDHLFVDLVSIGDGDGRIVRWLGRRPAERVDVYLAAAARLCHDLVRPATDRVVILTLPAAAETPVQVPAGGAR